MSLREVDHHTLEANLKRLLSDERRIQVDFLLHLAEFDRRRLYEAHGYAKLWYYCTKALGLSDNQTHYRTKAAEVLARFPIAADYLRDGRICMTILVELRFVLTEENHLRLFDAVVGKTKDEVRVLVASLAPKTVPDQTMIRRVVESTPISARTALPVPLATDAPGILEAPAAGASVSSEAEPSGAGSVAPAAVGHTRLHLLTPSRADTELLPVSANQYRIRMLVDREWVEMLNRLKSFYSHAVPSGDPREVISRALKAAIETETRRRDPARSRKVRFEVDETSGYIPESLRKLVWERDGGCCVWKTDSGPCGSTWQLQIDHILAVALGGRTVLENLRLLCREHNLMHARQDFGADAIAAKIAARVR